MTCPLERVAASQLNERARTHRFTTFYNGHRCAVVGAKV